MKRSLLFAFVAVTALVIASVPSSTATNNLVESGTSQTFSSGVVFAEILDDNTLLTIQNDGKIISGTLLDGKVTELWSYNLGVNATFAKLDQGQVLLAIIVEQGMLVFNLDSKQTEQTIQLSNIPDSLDWDVDGDIWVAYNSGLRKAREYSNGVQTSYQTPTITSGFLTFEVLLDNTMIIGGFDNKLHLFDKYGNLLTRMSEPNSYVSSLHETDEGILLAGSGDGVLHRYDYINSWTHSSINLGSKQIVSIDDYDDNHYFAIDSDNNIHFIDKSGFTKAGDLASISTTFYVVGEPGGQISAIYNTAITSGIMYYDLDSDGDGVADSADDFPTDSTQQTDADGDGYGDNKDGINGDQFPDNPEQHQDSDGDGYGDNRDGEQGDLFPDNVDQWSDIDNDGYGDNPDGLMGDKFIEDPTQWNDTDGDGYGDNPLGNSPDSCPSVTGFSSLDRFGCIDTDFDYYSNADDEYTVFDGADALPDDITQWLDTDGDGFGDNPAPASNPDSCPSVAGNSTQEIQRDGTIDGTILERFGCLDSDGDSFDDLSDNFPTDATEWFDFDEDGIGANSDYDDREKMVTTERDYCEYTGNQSRICDPWNDLDYVEYIDRPKEEGDSDLSYANWLSQNEAKSLDEDDSLVSAITDVAIVGGGIFVVATVLILLTSFVLKRRKLNDMIKRYGVPFEPQGNNTANQEALEDSAGLSATGGVESDDSWDDEVAAMDFTETSDELEESTTNSVSAEELYDEGTDMTELAGIEIASSEASEEEVSAMLQDASVHGVVEKPSNSPPIPESGLPEGWTMEQWEWYGHEWLARFGDN